MTTKKYALIPPGQYTRLIFKGHKYYIIEKEKVAIGDYVKVTKLLPGDPDPLPIGDTGIVENFVSISGLESQLWVKWNSGRSLSLLMSDPFIVYRRMKNSEEDGLIVEY